MRLQFKGNSRFPCELLLFLFSTAGKCELLRAKGKSNKSKRPATKYFNFFLTFYLFLCTEVPPSKTKGVSFSSFVNTLYFFFMKHMAPSWHINYKTHHLFIQTVYYIYLQIGIKAISILFSFCGCLLALFIICDDGKKCCNLFKTFS